MADKKKTLVVIALAVLGHPLCAEQITAELYSPSSYQKSSCSNLSPPAALSGATVPEEAYVSSILYQAFGATQQSTKQKVDELGNVPERHLCRLRNGSSP